MSKTEEKKEKPIDKAVEKPSVKEAVYTRDELAASKDFSDHKWLLFATLKADEQVTKAEAQKRVTAFLSSKM